MGEMNNLVVGSSAKDVAVSVIETQRLRDTLGIHDTQYETFDGLHAFMLDCLELILPGPVFSRFHTTVLRINALHWEWESQGCFAYRGLKQIGLLDEYHCDVIYRIQCWFDAHEVPCITTPSIEKCMMHEKGTVGESSRIRVGRIWSS